MSRLKRLLQRDADDRRPGALARVRLRRRLDRQERMREALLLDLGAIIFELHRQRRREPELLQAKAAELDAVDEEVRSLAHALDEGSELPALTASGLVATCTACGSLMGSRDRFCSHCGAAAGAVLPTSENGDGPAELDEGPDEDEGGEHEPGGEADAPGGEADSPSWEAGALGGPEDDLAAPDADERSSPLAESRADEEPGPHQPEQRAEDDLVKLAQSKLRAGRRAARRWMAERRPEAQ